MVRFSFVLLAVFAACAPAVENPAQVAQPIIGGAADSGDPAVVLLISYPQDQSTFYTCTASFVSPSVLVTAAHCVDDANHPSYVFGVFLGESALAYTTAAALAPQLVPVKEVHANPAYDPVTPFTADIGVVILNAPQTITPLPLQKATLAASVVGQSARLVGYGQTVYQTFNDAKFAVTTTVASLNGDDTVSVGDGTHHSCVGDSGGPALVMMSGIETIIGVDSYTDTAGCTAAAHYRRVDDYVGFLAQYLAAPPDLAPPASDLSAPHDLAGAASDLGASSDLASDLGARNDLTVTPNDLAAVNTDLSVAPNDLTANRASGTTQSSGGCSLAGGAQSPTAPLIPALFALFALIRRRPCETARR